MLKKLLAASIVCVAMVVPSVAAAASLDGETLTGTALSPDHTVCGDNGDGTSSNFGFVRGGVRGYTGVATGPVIGGFDQQAILATWNTATGSVISLEPAPFGSIDLYSADFTEDFSVDISLGSGQGVATCAADGSWTLNIMGATYFVWETGETGVANVSATQVGATQGTVTEDFVPQLPTSKAQCENNGWKTFPGFKNQGDCTSYVATKGKNAPDAS